MQELWDQRFSEEGFAYGSDPNLFFKEELDKHTPGKILLLGEGEGRNGVYAAQIGWQVDAFDFSSAAREKALKLAKSKGVELNYTLQDLQDITLPENYYDASALIYLHLDPQLRSQLIKKVIKALKPGGIIIMEVFDKEQLGRTSGGPKDPELLYSLEEIVEKFADLDFITLSKEVTEINEGKYHQGESVLIRFVGAKVE
ncbi:MAG: class I SAM-dependent methyltransferase [Bacteroidota bacterium]|nr:class I SAM-dependent methyltransferase [Bacteroidota bacterium]MDP4189980.1 class I SAM-dependent methyltransferase [Bacteroidota bacterium]MDP4193412.1 class I SAM-dependent methyltransferase [Bacteroidota bacterium]